MIWDKPLKPGNIPVFVPHAGCPHDCVFCNQKKITEQSEPFDSEQLEKYIDEHLKTMQGKRYPIEVAFFGGSFTGIEEEKQNAYLKIARRYYEDGLIHGIRLSTRPDYIDKDTLLRLQSYNVTTIELGVQSLDPNVLKMSKRGHDIQTVRKSVELIKTYNFNLGLQMMIGLPGDTLESALETAHGLIGLGADFVRVYPTVVIKDTELAQQFENGVYVPLVVDEAVRWLTEILPLFSRAGIPVIRVGLQATSTLNDKENCIAGAYHPSMRQLAQSALYLKKTRAFVEQIRNQHSKFVDIELWVHEKDWTPFRGIEAVNFRKLQEVFPELNLTFHKTTRQKRYQLIAKIVTDNKSKQDECSELMFEINFENI